MRPRVPRLSRGLVAGFSPQGRWGGLLAGPSFSPSSPSSSPLLSLAGAWSCWCVCLGPWGCLALCFRCPSRVPCGPLFPFSLGVRLAVRCPGRGVLRLLALVFVCFRTVFLGWRREEVFSWSSTSARISVNFHFGFFVAVSCTVLRVNLQLVQLMRGAPRSSAHHSPRQSRRFSSLRGTGNRCVLLRCTGGSGSQCDPVPARRVVHHGGCEGGSVGGVWTKLRGGCSDDS